MADPILAEIERLGFPDVLLWLLTFALVFGILSQTNMPKSKASRGIISISLAFLVMLFAPTGLIAFLSQASSGLILVVIAILVLVSFFEAAGVGATVEVPIIKDGKLVRTEHRKTTVFKKYPIAFTIAFILVALMIFLGAGGWQLLGFGNITLKGIGSESMVGIIFLVAVVIGVLWMIAESGKD